MHLRADPDASGPTLQRGLGLLGLVATGVCAMIGGAINIIPFAIQRTIPGIGPNLMPAYLLAAVPALLAGLALAVLASAMPRAGGTYVFASRALGPYLGFVASFSQWFAVSVAMGVVSYLVVPFLRDIAVAADAQGLASLLERGPVRLAISLGTLWAAVLVNLRGIGVYQRTVIPLMLLTLALGAIVVVAGFGVDHADFTAALLRRDGAAVPETAAPHLTAATLLPAAAVLFSTFIGFESIAQAGGEARNPGRNLPLAILIAVLGVAAFYFLFTAAVYHAVPWQVVAEQAARRDVTAPGLLGYVLPPAWTVLITAGTAVALIKDLPAMLLGVSRLMFAWGEDGIFPAAVARVHPGYRTPHVAILASGLMATASVVGCFVAGDFFLGVDILVTAMLVNFVLTCLSVIRLRSANPAIAARATVLPDRRLQLPAAALGAVVIALLLAIHTWRDLAGDRPWFLRSTWDWLMVMGLATLLYWRETARLRRSGVDLAARMRELPPQ